MSKHPGGSLPLFSTNSSPVTDNLLFLNQRKREQITRKMPDARVDLGIACMRNGHAADRATAFSSVCYMKINEKLNGYLFSHFTDTSMFRKGRRK